MRRTTRRAPPRAGSTPSRPRARWACSTPTLSLDDLADCDLIIEAVFENMDVKKEVFGKLDRIAKPGAILASNTSYLNVDEIAAATSRPQDVRRPALLLAGQRHEPARGGARREDRARRAGDGDAARQEDPQGRGRRRRLPRLHRQPHADAAPAPGEPPAPRRRDARADRPRPCRVRHADGPVPDGRPRRRRHRLAPRPEPDREYPRRALRRRPLGPEEGRRLLRL